MIRPLRLSRSLRAAVTAALLTTSLALSLTVVAGPAQSAPYYRVSASIPVATDPYEVAIDSAAHLAYVAEPDGNRVQVVDTTSRSVVDTISTGRTPTAIALDTSRDRAYVIEYDDRTLAEIDTTTRTVLKRYPIGIQALALSVDTTTHKVYVSNGYSWSVTVIDPTAPIDLPITISVPLGPVGIAVDPALRRAYVARARLGDVLVIDTLTNLPIGSIPTGGLAYKVALDPGTHRLYVANNSGDSVSVVDTTTNRVVATVDGIPAPVAIALDPSAGVAYVTSNAGGADPDGEHEVTVIDTATNTVRAAVPTSSQAYGIAVDRSTHEVFVPQQDTQAVAVITPGETVPQTISFTETPTNPARVGTSEDVAATGGGSGNPVTFSLGQGSTDGACTVTDRGDSTATVSYDNVGTCVVQADQAGALGYDAAEPQRITVEVQRGLQTVEFTSTPPDPATVGGTYRVTVDGSDTGMPVLVTIAIASRTVCALPNGNDPITQPSPTTVTFLSPGKCIITARQKGSDDYRQAPRIKQQVTVTE